MTGAVLAGGLGRRLGGRKAMAMLGGRPLVSYPLDALREVCERVAVVCKADTELPPLPAAAERWDEPEEPRHPLTGIVHALERAGAPVLVCAADMPFVMPAACRSLADAAAAAPEAPAVVAAVREGERLEPALAVYRPSALATLGAAAPDVRLTEVVRALEPVSVPLAPALLRSVNTSAELEAAERELAGP